MTMALHILVGMRRVPQVDFITVIECGDLLADDGITLVDELVGFSDIEEDVFGKAFIDKTPDRSVWLVRTAHSS
jgi:hypothetical protein